MNRPESIGVFGDSTAWGAWDTEKGGWVNRLWLYFGNRDENADWVELYNMSVSGGTTETVLARFESEAKIRECNALIFQSGGNDSSIVGSTGKNLVSPEKFEQNIEEIISRARKITENIIFIGFKNVDESKTNPVPWADISYINSEIQKYDSIMEKVCARNGIKYLSVFGLLEDDDFADGVHPNSAGHEKIYQKVKAFLVENSWIK